MKIWENPTEKDIEDNLKIVEQGKGELTMPLAVLDGVFKKRYKKKYGEFEKLTPEEVKAHKKAYQKTDKYKAHQKAYQKTDKYKAYQKAYQKTDKYKAHQKAYQKTDKYKAYKKAYYQRTKDNQNKGGKE
jgi:hypothetical protein